MRVFRSLFVGFATFLALLPFLFALTGQGILFIQLTLPQVNGILTDTLVRSLLTADNRHQPQSVHVAVAILHLHLVSVGSRYRHHRTQHRHVHRCRHTNETLLQSDGQRPHIHLHASLFSHRFSILCLIRRDAHFECVHNPVHQARALGRFLASRMDDAAHLLNREFVTGHHLQQPLLRVVADGSQVSRQLVQPFVALTFRRLTSRSAPILGNNRGISHALELLRELGWSVRGRIARNDIPAVIARVKVRAVLCSPVNAQPSVGIRLPALGHLIIRKHLIPPVGPINLILRWRDVDKPLRREARCVGSHAKRLAVGTLRLRHRHAQRQPDIDVQLLAGRVVLVQHHTLPLAANLDIQLLRTHISFLHERGIVNIHTRLPGETLRVNVLTVALVVTESRVVRTAKRQPALQLPLLLVILSGIDTLCQLLQPRRLRQRIVVSERARLYESPGLLLRLTRIECYHPADYFHIVSSFLVFRYDII